MINFLSKPLFLKYVFSVLRPSIMLTTFWRICCSSPYGLHFTYFATNSYSIKVPFQPVPCSLSHFLSSLKFKSSTTFTPCPFSIYPFSNLPSITFDLLQLNVDCFASFSYSNWYLKSCMRLVFWSCFFKSSTDRVF